MPARSWIVGLALCVVLGCVPHTDPPVASAPSDTKAVTPTPPNPPVAAPVATEPAATTPETSSPPAAAPTPELPPESPPPADPAANPSGENATEQVSAKAGVGKQGQSLKNDTGVFVEAAKAYFNVRQRAVFEIQIPEALKLFEATEGRKPNSHDEFMQKVINANSIKLPNLPANNKYVYDVERGELMVEKPAK